MAKFVEPTRSGSPIQVVNAGIRRDATFEAHSGFVDVDYGFYLFGVSLESGDSGSPVIGGHEIIGLYAGGGSGAYANNYAAWASSTL